MSEVRPGFFIDVDEVIVHNQHFCVRVAEAVDELVRSKRYVEGSKYGSEFDTCVPDGCVVDRVEHKGCYDIAFAYAVLDEGACDSV